MGPADQDMEWTEEGVEGISRFLRRLWRIVNEVAETRHGRRARSTDLTRAAHRTIARVTDDIDRRFQFNTPIAAVMELVNELGRSPEDPGARFAAETAVSLIQPYAPHIAEELWSRLGHERLWEEPWPEADPALLERETFELVIQVNGRVRDRVEVSSDASEDELVAQATRVGAGSGVPGRQGDPQGDRRPGQAREPRRRLANPGVDVEVDAFDAVARHCHGDGRGIFSKARLFGAAPSSGQREGDAVPALLVRRRGGDDLARAENESFTPFAGAVHGTPTRQTGIVGPRITLPWRPARGPAAGRAAAERERGECTRRRRPSSSGLLEQPMVGSPPPRALTEKQEQGEDHERTDHDESVEHCDCFFPQNVAGVTQEAVEPARYHVLRGRLARRQPERDRCVRAFADEVELRLRETSQGCALPRRGGSARPGCGALGREFGDAFCCAAIRALVDRGRLEVVDRDVLREDRPQFGEAGDRLLEVLRPGRAASSGRVACLRAGRVVGGGDEAAEPPRRRTAPGSSARGP